MSDNRKIFSLLEVTTSIQRTLAARYSSAFWVKAEMNKLNYYPHSGHCYPDLVEKQDGRVIAQLNSTLWRDDFNRINRNFLEIVKVPLKDGISMLFCARITFDPMHGLALRIIDIDPVFSLGELEREKQESIARLRSEGLFNRNKSLSFPVLPQRMAIISVQTSKGYADFLKVIEGNSWGYKFFHVLFPSLLQGDRAIDSIMYQLERIRKVASHFDVVAIIRGGGGEVGLSCFNDYMLSKAIASFPLPVITGIGHATNETVAEMVAWRNAITPTELADFLLQKFHDFSLPVQRAEEIITDNARRLLLDERRHLQHAVKYFRSVAGNVLAHSHREVEQSARDLSRQSSARLARQRQEHTSIIYKVRSMSRSMTNLRLQELQQLSVVLRKDAGVFLKQQGVNIDGMVRAVANMDPQNVLRRGYTITRVNGKAVTSVSQVSSGDRIETRVADGTVSSTVESTIKSSDR